MKTSALILVAVLLSGCAAPDPARKASSPPTPPSADAGLAQPLPPAVQAAQAAQVAKVAQLASTPLSDLNLVRAEIPAILHAAQRGPYRSPSNTACAGIAAEVQALDAVLGPDLDTAATATNPGLVERGAGAVDQVAVGAIRGAAEGIVPFRGWVRKLSGAERYSAEVAAAIAAGTVRRSYLKGLGQAAQCAAPAAPRSVASAAPDTPRR